MSLQVPGVTFRCPSSGKRAQRCPYQVVVCIAKPFPIGTNQPFILGYGVLAGKMIAPERQGRKVLHLYLGGGIVKYINT